MTAFTLFDHQVNIQLPDHIATDAQLQSIVDNFDSLLAPSVTHGYFDTPSHGKLHYRKYLPSDKPKGIVVYQHGIQADCAMSVKLGDDDYTNMGLISRTFTKAGYAMYAPDMLGHGLSEGERFYIPNGDWTINRDHLESFAQMACGEFNDDDDNDGKIPLFLMGESYGGTLTLHVARQWQNHPERIPSNANFKGIMLNAPAIVGDLPILPVVWMLRYGLAPIMPRKTPFFMPHPVSPERIWKNEQVLDFYTSPESKLLGLHGNGKKFCLGTAVGLLNALECVRDDTIPGLTVPFCVHHGTRDEGVKTEGTDFLLKHCTTEQEDQSVTMVEDALHDLLSDDTKDQTMETIVSWMESRLQKD